MRSIGRALSDASMLALSLKITRPELIGVNVDRRGGIGFHLTTEGFLRLFKAMRVPGSKVRASTHEGAIHARFCMHNAEWFAIFKMGQDQWDGLLNSNQPRISQSSGAAVKSIRINGKSELLCLPGPSHAN